MDDVAVAEVGLIIIAVVRSFVAARGNGEIERERERAQGVPLPLARTYPPNHFFINVKLTIRCRMKP